MNARGLGFYSGDNVPKKTKWLYSVAAIGRDGAYALVSLFLLTFIQYSGILTPLGDVGQYAAMFAVISGLVIGYRIFDALNDPFMGVIIEKVHFKTGKYKPWILIGAITNAIVVFCLFCVPQYFTALQGWGYVAWFAVFYLLWGITFTMNDIAYWAMLPSLTSDEKQRATITTIMSVFCSVGQFIVAGLTPIISANLGYQNGYQIITYAILAVFLGLQILLYFLAPEHKRNVEEEAKHEPPHFKDMFKILKRNDQARWATIIFLIYYTGAGILNALGINYFYFAVNYSVGSLVMTIFTVIYAVGVIIAQFSFPALSKRFTRKTLWTASILLNVIGYLAFFIYGLPLGNGNYLSPSPIVDGAVNILYLIPLCVIGIVIFSSQGLMNMMLIMMMSNTIEYNEYKFGERKEAVIFSLRPLTAKLSSAIQQGVLYLFLLVSGLMTFVSQISSYQQAAALDSSISTDTLNSQCDVVSMNASSIDVLIYKLGVAILPMVLFIVTYFLQRKFYKIDEKKYADMCVEIKRRQNNYVGENPTVE